MKRIALSFTMAAHASLMACSGGATGTTAPADGGQDETASPADGGQDGTTVVGLEAGNGGSPMDAANSQDGSATLHDASSADAATANGGSGTATHCTTLYVDAVHGADTNAGTSNTASLKTITHAIAAATSCTKTILVAAGTYDTSNGETFPLAIPDGVAIIGDEPNKGNAPGAQTLILGQASGVLVRPGRGSTIAGFKITYSGMGGDGIGIVNSGVTARNNTLKGPGAGPFMGLVDGIDIGSSATNVVIAGNIATGWVFGYLVYGQNTVSFESNTGTGNNIGIEVSLPAANLGVDLGGGIFQSPGKNTFACNKSRDLIVDGAGVVVSARDDIWSDAPPTLVEANDGAPFPDTSGATAIVPPCQ